MPHPLPGATQHYQRRTSCRYVCGVGVEGVVSARCMKTRAQILNMLPDLTDLNPSQSQKGEGGMKEPKYGQVYERRVTKVCNVH